MSGMRFLMDKKKREMEEMEKSATNSPFPQDDEEEEVKNASSVEAEDVSDEEDDDLYSDDYAPPRQQQPPPPIDNGVKAEKVDNDEALLARLKEHFDPDEWEYLDEGERRRLLAVMKASEPRFSVSEQVDMAFQERAGRKKAKSFVNQLNKHLKKHNTNFTELVNSSKFESWLNGSRKRANLFESSLRYHDKESLDDLKQLTDEFYSSQQVDSNDGSPQVGKGGASSKAGSKGGVTEEAYNQAIKDLRHPSRREKAREIIAKYEKQNG